MTEEQIKHMVDRFLGWKLPHDFNPDGGVIFRKTFNDHLPTPTENEPSGTNLLDSSQAHQMVRYMIQGMPEAVQIMTQQDAEMDKAHAVGFREGYHAACGGGAAGPYVSRP